MMVSEIFKSFQIFRVTTGSKSDILMKGVSCVTSELDFIQQEMV